MTDIYTSPMLDEQGKLNITKRKESNHGRPAMMGMRKDLYFGDVGSDFIDSILSREETEDVITMMNDADESQGCLHLPTFYTSSQIGFGNQARRPTSPSFFPSLILPGGGLPKINDLQTSMHHSTDHNLMTEVTDKVRENNSRNTHSGLEASDQNLVSSTQIDKTPFPGTTSDTILGVVLDEEIGHDASPGCDPNPELMTDDGPVARHVTMTSNVTTVVDDVVVAATEGGDDNDHVGMPIPGAGKLTPEMGDLHTEKKDGSPAESESCTSDGGSEPSRLDTISSKMGLERVSTLRHALGWDPTSKAAPDQYW